MRPGSRSSGPSWSTTSPLRSVAASCGYSVFLKKAKTSGGVGEEEVEHTEKEIQKLTDQYIAKIDGHVTSKEKEIMTV